MDQMIPNKTPVSWLHELCTRSSISPKYELLQVEGAVHEPIFQYRITLDYNGVNIIESGSGRSKKEAKHNAARLMLRSMKVRPSDLLGPTQQSQHVDLEELGIDGDFETSGNPVGILQELCMKMKHPPPTYEVHSEEGLPHERQFAIVCKVGEHFEAIGKGKSKKLAKRKAAHMMADRLRSVPLEQTNANVFDEDDEKIVEQLVATRSKRKIGQNIHKSNSKLTTIERVANQTNMYKHLMGEKINLLHANENNNKDDIEAIENIKNDPAKFLKELEAEQRFEAIIIPMDDPDSHGQHQCFIQTTLEPPTYFYGYGDTPKEAKIKAIEDLISGLRRHTKFKNLEIKTESTLPIDKITYPSSLLKSLSDIDLNDKDK